MGRFVWWFMLATMVAAPSAVFAQSDTGGTSASEPPPTDSSDTSERSDPTFELKVKSLEERVTDLKEKIYRTKARLLQLQEAVLSDQLTAGAKAVLIHRNEMGASFVMESVAYALDGAPIFTKVDNDGDLDEQEEIEIFNGRIVPGNHQISVKVKLRGSGFGVFSYLDGYKFTVSSSYTFNAEGGKSTEVKIVSFEKGNITTDLKDRPAVRYEEERTKDLPRRSPRASAGGGSP